MIGGVVIGVLGLGSLVAVARELDKRRTKAKDVRDWVFLMMCSYIMVHYLMVRRHLMVHL